MSQAVMNIKIGHTLYSTFYRSDNYSIPSKFTNFLALEKTHCKKRLPISRPQLGCCWREISIPRQGQLVSDITAGDGKIGNLFYSAEKAA